jgi:hypothetical protein
VTGRRLQRTAAAAALGLAVGVALGALAIFEAGRIPTWSVPVLVAGAVLVCELVDLGRSVPADAAVERPAVAAVVAGRLLVIALLASAAATLALLAAAVPARHGLAAGLVGIAAAGSLFVLVGRLARD